MNGYTRYSDEMYGNSEHYEMLKAMKERNKRIEKMSKEEALAVLVRAGLITNGALRS